MASYGDNKHRIILDKPEHWDAWLSYIKGAVNNEALWGLVNLDLSTKPARTPYPREPARPQFSQDGVLDPNAMDRYKALRLFREEDLATFNNEDKALRAINKLIFETTSARIITQVAYSKSGPWSKLTALKQRLRPTKQTLSLQVEKRFHLLAKGPANQNVDAWLTEWTDMYHEAKRMDIPEVSGDRAIRDFLLAVESVDPTYGNGRQEARNTIEDQNFDLGDRKLRQRTMDEEIERFRNRIRLQQNSSVIKTSRSAFATDIKPRLKGKDQQGKRAKSETPLCICGDKMYYADCPYLVPSKAPTGWKEDPIVRKTVNDALKDTKIQA